MKNKLYLIGSLRNDRIPVLANTLRQAHPEIEVFDDWFAAGPEADDHWKAYEIARGRNYREALEGYAAKNVYAFDKRHLDSSTHVLLVLPAGKSGHMEIMYAAYGAAMFPSVAILLDPEDIRWDVMYQFVPTILNKDADIGPWLELTAGRRQSEIGVSDGGRVAGLLSKRARGGRTSLDASREKAHSWGTTPLGAVQVNRSPKQDHASSCG